VPHIIDPNNSASSGIVVTKGEYSYPLGNDLRPGTKVHTHVLHNITQRAQYSKSQMQKRYPIWDKMHEKLTSYILPDTDGRGPKHGPNAVVIPMSAAVLDTMVTYHVSTFADGPLFLCRPIGPEDKIKAALLELLLDNHMKRSKSLLTYYVQIRDASICGLGVVHNRWMTEYRTKKVLREKGFVSDVTGEFIATGQEEKNQRVLHAEYNISDNINPYCYFPDPTVPVHRVQDGEFVAFSSQVTYSWLLDQERNAPREWFNCKYVKNFGSNSEFSAPNSTLDTVPTSSETGNAAIRPVTLLYCYAHIVPREWKVGAGEYPEKWLFCVANDSVLVRAQPLNLDHNMFPVAVAAPNFDGYSVAPIGTIEQSFELQEAADKYYRTRMKTLETVANVKMIVDPYLARYDDAISLDSNVIRIREHVWGRGVEGAAKQLDLSDPAPGLLGEIAAINDWAQRGSGAVDSLQGIVRPTGERRSATEMRDTRMSAVSRLQTKSRLISLQSMMDIGRQWACNVAQFATQEKYVEFMGGYARELQQVYGAAGAMVSPEELRVDVDIDVLDASAPGGEFLPDLINLFQLSQSNPQSAMAFDATKQVLDLYKRANVRGATQFLRVTPQVVPDEVAAAAAAVPGAQPAGDFVNA